MYLSQFVCVVQRFGDVERYRHGDSDGDKDYGDGGILMDTHIVMSTQAFHSTVLRPWIGAKGRMNAPE